MSLVLLFTTQKRNNKIEQAKSAALVTKPQMCERTVPIHRKDLLQRSYCKS